MNLMSNIAASYPNGCRTFQVVALCQLLQDVAVAVLLIRFMLYQQTQLRMGLYEIIYIIVLYFYYGSFTV